MTKEQAKEILPIFKAFAEGKTIQILNEGEWCDLYDTDFKSPINKYRIKPEPKYRPFNDQEECWNEMHKHPDLGWVMAKNKKELVQIDRILMSKLDNVMITLSIDEGRNINSSYYFNRYTFTDGTPFGVKDE